MSTISKRLISPAPLQKGDTVGIVALACKVNLEAIKPGIEILENWGLNVVLGQSVFSDFYQFAGEDEIRKQDFQQMIDNQEIKAIFSARGGYGSSRIMDFINFSRFQENPKWVIGFSDITAVHGRLHQLGIESLHATMPKLFGQAGGAFALESLKKLLFGQTLSYQIPAQDINRLGLGQGQLIGGNLCLISHLMGSIDEVETDGKILFLEDISEYLYAIDRMMVQLKRAKKLERLKGLIVGHFSDMMDNETPFGKNPNEIIAEHVAQYDYPVCYGFPVGHEPANWAMPCGRLVKLVVAQDGVSLTEI